MNEGDVQAHNALTTVQAFYGGALTRQAKEHADFKRTHDVVLNQFVGLSAAVAEKQNLAAKALKLMERLPPADDGLDGVDSTLDQIAQLLRDIAKPVDGRGK